MNLCAWSAFLAAWEAKCVPVTRHESRQSYRALPPSSGEKAGWFSVNGTLFHSNAEDRPFRNQSGSLSTTLA